MITAPQREFYIIRWVVSLEELIDAFEVLGGQFAPPFTRRDRQIEALLVGYPQDRGTMLVAEKAGRIIGGVLGSGGIVRIIALEAEARGIGLGQR